MARVGLDKVTTNKIDLAFAVVGCLTRNLLIQQSNDNLRSI